MRNHLQKLFAHEHWANHRLLLKLIPVAGLPPRTRQLCPHIIAAHQFWEKRLRGEQINAREYDFFPAYPLEECEARNNEFAEKWEEYLNALPAPVEAQTLTFPGKDGKKVTLSIVDILTQLHSHSVHHRAQIALDLRNAGIEPVDTDYIRFCREQG